MDAWGSSSNNDDAIKKLERLQLFAYRKCSSFFHPITDSDDMMKEAITNALASFIKSLLSVLLHHASIYSRRIP